MLIFSGSGMPSFFEFSHYWFIQSLLKSLFWSYSLNLSRVATRPPMHPCDVDTVFKLKFNLYTIQTQTKYSEFLCTQTDVLLVMTFRLAGICHASTHMLDKDLLAYTLQQVEHLSVWMKAPCTWFEFEFVSSLNLNLGLKTVITSYRCIHAWSRGPQQ